MNPISHEKIKNKTRFIIPQMISNTVIKCWVNNNREFEKFDRENILKRQASYQIQFNMIKSYQEICDLQYNFLLISLIDEEKFSISYQIKSYQKLQKIEVNLNKFQQQFNKEQNILNNTCQLRINNLQIKLIDIQNLLDEYQMEKLIRIKHEEIDSSQGQQQEIYSYEYQNGQFLDILMQIQQNDQLPQSKNYQNFQTYLLRILQRHIQIINNPAKQRFLENQYSITINLYDLSNLLNPQDNESKLKKAIYYYKLKKYNQALKLLQDIQTSYQNEIQIWYYIANIYKARKKYVDAINLYDRILEKKPQFTKSYQQKAQIYSVDRSQQENDMYDKILNYDPNNIKIIEKKVSWCYYRQKYQDGLINVEKLIQLKPTDATVYFTKGVLLQKLGQSGEAMKCYNQAIQLNPGHDTAYNHKGVLLEELGQLGKAMKCYDKAIQLNPRATYYDNKGVLLEELGQSSEAMKCYDRAIEFDPTYAISYSNKGLLLQKQGRSNEAMECYDKAIELNPKEINAFNNKGRIFYKKFLHQQGRLEEILNLFDKAIEYNSTDATYYIIKGYLLQQLGRSYEAVKCYDRAIEFNPTGANYYLIKGYILQQLGRSGEAQNLKGELHKQGQLDEILNLFDKLIEFNPTDASNQIMKGQLLQQLGRSGEAMKCYDRAIEFNPTDATYYIIKGYLLQQQGRSGEAMKCYDAYNNKGILLPQQGRSDEALNYLEKAIYLNPTFVAAYYNLGAILVELGQEGEAWQCYFKATQIDEYKNKKID